MANNGERDIYPRTDCPLRYARKKEEKNDEDEDALRGEWHPMSERSMNMESKEKILSAEFEARALRERVKTWL